MGDVLQGVNARWTFRSGSIIITPEPGLSSSRLLQRLGRRIVPVDALSEVSLRSGKRGGLVLRAVPRPGADPVMDVADGQLDARSDPYVLLVPRESTGAARRRVRDMEAVIEPAGPAREWLVEPPLAPQRFKGWDGSARFDGTTVRLQWFWSSASRDKYAGGRQVYYPISRLRGVVWRSPRDGGGHLRLLLPRATSVPDATHDPAALLFGKGYGLIHESLPFAAAVLAAIGRRDPGRRDAVRRDADGGDAETTVPSSPRTRLHPDELVSRVRKLGEMHKAGLLSDTEFAAKKAELLADL